jgi:hypothetical protein
MKRAAKVFKDNPPCCNPYHFFLGTNQANSEDKVSKGRQAVGAASGRYTHPETTPRGESHFKARLTEAAVLDIRERAYTGPSRKAKMESYARLSTDYNVPTYVVGQVARGVTWRHLLPASVPVE